MDTDNKPTIRRIAAATIIGTLGSGLLVATVVKLFQVAQEILPWWWPWPLVIGVALLVIALLLLVPTSWWKQIGRLLANLLPIRLVHILYQQARRPNAFLFIQKPRFEFLLMSGGTNSREWTAKFNIVSCLFRDLRVDRIDIMITYPITETWTVKGDFLLAHFGFTEIESGRANMSDTTFHYLEKQSKVLKQKGTIPIRCEVIGFRNDRKLLTIDDSDCYDGELNAWGHNNVTS